MRSLKTQFKDNNCFFHSLSVQLSLQWKKSFLSFRCPFCFSMRAAPSRQGHPALGVVAGGHWADGRREPRGRMDGEEGMAEEKQQSETEMRSVKPLGQTSTLLYSQNPKAVHWILGRLCIWESTGTRKKFMRLNPGGR